MKHNINPELENLLNRIKIHAPRLQVLKAEIQERRKRAARQRKGVSKQGSLSKAKERFSYES